MLQSADVESGVTWVGVTPLSDEGVARRQVLGLAKTWRRGWAVVLETADHFVLDSGVLEEECAGACVTPRAAHVPLCDAPTRLTAELVPTGFVGAA